MTKTEHQRHRQQVLNSVYSFIKAGWTIPSYQSAVAHLNAREIRTARGNPWTRKRLFRFLQNAGYSGLWGISKAKTNDVPLTDTYLPFKIVLTIANEIKDQNQNESD